ncbi:MAG: class I tRNA ligase family protein [Chitinophagaceae bacterium]
MEYNFREIEQKWQKTWKETHAYKVENDFSKPKYYVLDMFPYPSGAGLHVGHPLGYISTDIFARYKRLKGYNVLHPMGYDAFGLPAEQYAIEHGVHPAVSTEQNINNFRKQLDNIGFCFDWDREVKTSEPGYYKWTQWIFLQLFKSWYNRETHKAEYIDQTLVPAFEKDGSKIIDGRRADLQPFTAEDWKSYSEREKSDILMQFRLAYCDYGIVNWCEALGTVLANDEVINGVSERGGFPVEKKKLRQWYLRITEYADRLLDGLKHIDFSDAMKEMQTNWIGKSQGAEIDFLVNLTPDPSPKGEGRRGVPISTTAQGNWGILKEYARDNRQNQTDAENRLWQKLRSNQLGEKVRRQHLIQGYIADFVFLNSYLVVEIDGGYHDATEQKKYDDARTRYLEEFGYKVIRFTNEEVTNDVNKVILDIKTALESQHKTLTKPAALGVASPLSLGRGVGGEVKLTVYTTRPDTIFGVDFMVIAPEHELIDKITTPDQKQAIDDYVAYVKSRSERERQAEKKITGCFTGAYAVNPFNGKEIPIWTAEYVLAGYGTGAVMAVPCGDERDYKFAKQFNLPITNILGDKFDGENANPTKDAILENSDFITGKHMKEATEILLAELEDREIGHRKVNYRMRDAAFSRQRFWGEPIPIKWMDGVAIPLDEKELPLELPEVESYKPGSEGQGPLANVKEWTDQHLETNTMPGYAGSSWYFLRYMDPHNTQAFCDRKVSDYWNQVDLYLGGTEHAVGHLLYSRLWTKILFDLGYIGFDEPYKKLVNQGMIQGSSRFVYRLGFVIAQITEDGVEPLPIKKPNIFISKKLYDSYSTKETQEYLLEFQRNIFKKDNPNITDLPGLGFSPQPIHVDVNIVDGFVLDTEAFKKWKPEFADAEFVLENGKYICGSEVEKMSKSKFNTVNPDELVNKYGADTFRMYEMFLGPVEQSKPWETKGIEGVHRFLKKLWRLVFDENKGAVWIDENPTDAELKTLHKTIKKVGEDIERLSLNTCVSAFMVAVNELSDQKCHKRAVIEPLLVLLTPYAPHVAEEIWHAFGNTTSILDAPFPTFDEKYLKESAKNYPVSINGKLRTNMEFALDADKAFIEASVLQNEIVLKWLDGKDVKKFVFVPGKMINLVI